MLAHIPDKVADLHLKVAREFYQNSLEALKRRVEVQTIKLTLDEMDGPTLSSQPPSILNVFLRKRMTMVRYDL